MAAQPKPPIGKRWLNRSGTKVLSEAYQRRLMRNGVTEAEFRNKNFKLDKARGHNTTPEHKLDVDSATPQQKQKYSRYLARKTDETYVFSTEGIRGPFPIKSFSRKQEALIRANWYRIRTYLAGDDTSMLNLPSFKGVKVGGKNGVPRMSLEYRLDEIDRAAQAGTLPDKPVTLGS